MDARPKVHGSLTPLARSGATAGRARDLEYDLETAVELRGRQPGDVLCGEAPTMLEEFRRELSAHGRVRRHAKGSVLMRQGDESGFVLFLLEGRVRIIHRWPDGSEFCLAHRKNGELLGELTAFDDEPRTADVIAVGRCSTTYIPVAHFRAMVKRRGLELEFLRRVCRRLHESELRLAGACVLPPAVRLARCLLELAGSSASLEISGWTQGEIALSIGASLPTVTLVLKKLRETGVLETDRGRIKITNLQALRKRAEDEPADSSR